MEHKAGLEADIARLSVSPIISADFGQPLVDDWVVDVYFSEDDDATAFPVILDSGSSNLAVAIDRCLDCHKASTKLDPTLASPERCIEVTYGSGAWKGVEVAPAYVGLSADLFTDAVAYAGITYQDVFFSGGGSYVGILGMAYQGIASNYMSSSCSRRRLDDTVPAATSDASGDFAASGGSASTSADSVELATPLMYNLYSSGAVSENAFGITMCGDAATVSLGGIDSAMYQAGSLMYATSQKVFGEYYGYYMIYTSGVSVAGASVTVENINLYGGLVVDTGTTLHYLPTATVKAIETAVTSATSLATTSLYDWDACVSASDLTSFPDITYTFSESSDDDASTFDVLLKPKHYMLDLAGCYYWGFEESSLGIFGNIGMRHRAMVFDITNSRIGIGNGVCHAADDDGATLAAVGSGAAVGKAAVGAAEPGKEHTSWEMTVGLVSAMAVVGTVLASAFVVLNKVTAQAAGRSKAVEEEESVSLLPPL